MCPCSGTPSSGRTCTCRLTCVCVYTYIFTCTCTYISEPYVCTLGLCIGCSANICACIHTLYIHDVISELVCVYTLRLLSIQVLCVHLHDVDVSSPGSQVLLHNVMSALPHYYNSFQFFSISLVHFVTFCHTTAGMPPGMTKLHTHPLALVFFTLYLGMALRYLSWNRGRV